MRVSRSKCVSVLFLCAVMFALFVSGAALNYLGLNYSGDESVSGMKIHPYVLTTLIATILLAMPLGATRSRMFDKRFRVPIICSVLVIAVLILRSFGSGRQSLGFAVDTLVSALWVAAIVPFLSERVAKRVLQMGFAFVVVECVMAVIEVVAKINFIPVDTWYGSYFRATALHGHPLNNALVLVVVSVSLQISVAKKISVFIFIGTIGALSAFGARGAVAFYLLVNILWLIRFGMASPSRLVTVMTGGPVAIFILMWIFFSGALGDRIANVGAYDDSSGVRLQSIQMLQSLNWSNLIVGTGPDQVLIIMGQENVNVIENFLVAYIFMFGLACTLLIFLCFWIVARKLSKSWGEAPSRIVYIIFIVFLMTALTNNSLVTKTPALYLCVVFSWAAACVQSTKRSSVRPAQRLRQESQIVRSAGI